MDDLALPRRSVREARDRLYGLRPRISRSQSCASMNVRPRGLPHLSYPPRDNLERIVGQRPLQLECCLGWRIHPDVDFLARRQNDGHRFRMDCPDLLIRFGRQKPEDIICCLAFLDFPNRGPTRPDARKEGQWPGIVEGEPTGGREPSGRTSFSEKLVQGTTQRFSIPSQRRQCGDLTLRTLVTPGSDFLPFSAKTGDGMPHRAIISSRPSGWLRTIGAK